MTFLRAALRSHMAVTVSIVTTALIGLFVFLAGRVSVAGIDDAGMEAAPFTTCPSSAQAVCSAPDTTLMALGSFLMVTAVSVAFASARRCAHLRADQRS